METSPNVKKRIDLVHSWLNNLKKGKINKVILLIIVKTPVDEKLQNEIKNSIKKNFFQNEEKELKFNVFKLNECLHKDSKILTNEANTILLASRNLSVNDIKKIQREVLCLDFPNFHYETPDDCFNKINIDHDMDITDRINIPFLIGEKDPSDILSLDISLIKLFISNLTIIRDEKIQNFLKNTNLYHDTNDLIDGQKYKRLSLNQSIYEEYLLRDIIILKEKAILTSRLSIAIYRKAKLNFNANVTEIGRYYSKKFSKSIIVDLKKLSQGSSIDYDDLSKTTVKAYNVSKVKIEKEIKEEFEMAIKERIARKILSSTDLDIDTIATIVELSKDTIKSYQQEMQYVDIAYN